MQTSRPQAKMGPASQAVQGKRGNLLYAVVTKHKFGKLKAKLNQNKTGDIHMFGNNLICY